MPCAYHPAHRIFSQKGLMFSMMKRKFGGCYAARPIPRWSTRLLCKVLSHNLVVLTHEMFELGIDPVFWQAPTIT